MIDGWTGGTPLEGLSMRVLVVFIILLVGIGFYLSERNHCYWHGADYAIDWATCLTQ